MGRSTLIVLTFFLFITNIFSQGLFTNSDDRIYHFLNRINEKVELNGFDDFNLPLTRKQIAGFLEQIKNNIHYLEEKELNILNYYIIEYDKEISSSDDNLERLIKSRNFNLFNDNPKYLYYYFDSAKIFIGIKSLLNVRSNYLNGNSEYSAQLFELGGNISGSINNYFGYEIQGTNGFFINHKMAATAEKELNYNFKINEKEDSRFFDRTYGYLAFENPYIIFKVGSDKIFSGYGINKLILGDESPKFSYLNFRISYKSFYFDYHHGWLNGPRENYFDSSIGIINNVDQKYFSKHQIGFSPFSNFNLSIGEILIYSRQSPEIAYLNPFNFYKSTEHSLGDRDNSLLFTSAKIKIPKISQMYFTLLIDDVDFSKLGTKWYGNQFAYNIGISTEILYPLIYTSIKLEYSKIAPYVYTHRILKNNYTHDNITLGSYLNPNSDEFLINLDFNPDIKFYSNLTLALQRHGKNIYGHEIINYGGDINLGHRVNDPEEVSFLDGNLEHTLLIKLKSEYEVIKNFKTYIIFNYSKHKHDSLINEILFLSLGFISFI